VPPKPDPTRRRLLLGAAAAAGMHAARGAASMSGASTPLAELGAAQAVALMSSGELRCERYAEALLERCRSARALNAFITLEPERVLADARTRDRERRRGAKPGPLFGLPIPVKDSVNTRNYPTTGGTPALRGFRPSEDAPVIAALRGAGAIVLGKTNLHELSYGWTSNNLAFGAVHNPYDLARIPGGSSGGTGAAIAARLAPLGIAEDTEGSIRVPAAFCGIAGFRPTTGRYSTAGCVPISPLFDQVGPHARNVTDLLLFDAVATTFAAATSSSTPTRSLRGVRLGVARDYWFEALDPEVERITADALTRLERAGVVLVEEPLPGLAELIGRVTDPVQNHDVRLALPRYLAAYRAGVTFDELVERASPDIRAVFKQYVLAGGSDFVTESVYADARDRYLPQLRELYRNYFARARVAALVFPAVRVPPPLIGQETTLDVGGRPVDFEDAVARNIAPGSTAGLPGLVLPAGLTAQGLPVALEFDGPAGSDRELLTLGLGFEQALGTVAPPRL
jgi:indoleacetamide hydrolase